MANGYIRVVRVPEKCFECKLTNACSGTCIWAERKITDANTRPGWCPIYIEGGVKNFWRTRARHA